ncbi:nitroreductase family protein [Chloroflexota bacterium]
MAFLDLVKQRRSVRSFLDKPVEREKIIMCLESARLAPSASNSQPWRFIVVNDRNLKNRLCGIAFGGIYFINTSCKTAPVIIAVISEKSKFLTRIGELFRGTKFCLIDVGIACEHLVLEAEDLGLGTCWIGWFNEKAVKSVLKIPENKKVDILIALGYYDRNTLGPEHDREPLEEIASFNSY